MALTRQSFQTTLGACALAASIVALQPRLAQSAGEVATGSVSGLPIPRFVSLKSDRLMFALVRTRTKRCGGSIPMRACRSKLRPNLKTGGVSEIGKALKGWVYHSLLSGKRTAMVLPKAKNELVPLFESADIDLAVAARLQSGVLGALKSCNGNWCQFSGKGFEGYIRQERLWGAYPNEKVD